MGALRNRIAGRVGDERGMAMITALMAVLVASMLGAVVMDLSVHTSQASAYDRARTQSVHAAEAGLDQAMAHFAAVSIDTLPCNISGTLNATPVATFSVDLTYYAAYPLTGTALPCSGGYLSSTTVPHGVALESTGTVTGWQDGTVERHMQSELSLEPVYGTFDKAIFSDQTPGIANRLTVYGEDGNDADVLTNGDFNCTNSLTVYGSVYAQGTASLSNSCRTTQDLWANGAISMANSARADHDIKSSTGSLTMGGSSYAGNNIQVAGSCTGCSGRFGGTLTTGYSQGPPPSETFPEITFDESAWTDEGYTILNYTDCTAARTWINDPSHKAIKAVVHITGGCPLTFANNTTVTRTADLAVVTDGEISTKNNTSFVSGDSGWHSLYLIVESGSSCTGDQGYVSTSNLTQFTKIYFFVYSPCASTFANNNSTGRGQVYGKTVTLANNLTFTFHAMLVPGNGTITSFDSKVQFVREVN
jgi:Tfp pilus assembly protein PilX